MWLLAIHWANISFGSSLKLIISILERCNIISSTVLSDKSRAPKIRSRSSFSTTPSRCPKEIAPAISSRTAKICSSADVRTPKTHRIPLTSFLTADTMGSKIVTKSEIGADTLAAAFSAFVIA